MNKLNLLRLNNLYGLDADISVGHLALRIPYPRADGRGDIYMTGYGLPPHLHESDKFAAHCSHLSDPKRTIFAELDLSIGVAAQVLDALGRHAQFVSATAKDRALSVEGQAVRNAEATKEALTSIGSHFATLRKLGADVAGQEQTLFAPPPADLAATQWDVVQVTKFHAISREAQLTALRLLDRPEGAPLLLALKRSPQWMLDDQSKTLMTNAWSAKIEAEQPQAYAALQVSKENHEWAVGLTQLLARTVADPTLNGTAGQLPRAKLYEVLKPVGATDLLRFAASEAAMHEIRRIEIESAAAA